MGCDYIHPFTWEGEEREYLLHIPPDLVPGAPLVMCMRGLSGTMEDMRAATRFHELADEFGFAVCCAGVDLGVGWVAASVLNEFVPMPVDDVGF